MSTDRFLTRRKFVENAAAAAAIPLLATTSRAAPKARSHPVREAAAERKLRGFTIPSVAQEYYVTRDGAGKIAIIGHKPKGARTIVSGPFKTREEALKAAKETMGIPAQPGSSQSPAGNPRESGNQDR